MGLFIGIDGGGTKTKCVLADDQLNTLAEFQGGPTNPLAVGIDNSCATLTKLIQNFLRKFPKPKVESAVIGLAGAGRKKVALEIEKRIRAFIRQKKILIRRVKVVGDVEVALEGALAGEPGIILIAGTGSIVLGKNKSGKLFRIGGYGKVIGDEGSGYAIGKKALEYISKEIDGRGDKTSLTKVLRNQFGISDKDDLITSVYSSGFNIAGFAEYVIEAARLGDKIARKILAEESEELVAHIHPLQKHFGKEKMKLCLSGGLLLSRNYYSNLLRRKIKRSFRNIELEEIRYPAEVGAAILATKIHK